MKESGAVLHIRRQLQFVIYTVFSQLGKKCGGNAEEDKQ